MTREKEQVGPSSVGHQAHGVGSFITRINQEYSKKFGDILMEPATGDLVNFVPTTATKYGQVSAVDVEADVGSPTAVEIKDDGTRVYASGLGDNFYQWDLSTPWDLTTMGAVSSVLASEASLGFQFAQNGNSLYSMDNFPGVVREYSLTTAWDITTISSVATNDVASDANGGFHMKDDLSMAYWGEAGVLKQYEMTTPGDVATLTKVGETVFDDSTNPDSVRGMAVTNDGAKAFVSMTNANSILIFEFGTTFDITTAQQVGEVTVPNGSIGNDPGGIALADLDQRMYFCHNANPAHIKHFEPIQTV